MTSTLTLSRSVPPAALPGSCGCRLTREQLTELVALYAEEVRNGALVPEYRDGDRWHARIYQDDQVDVWLITWTRDQGTELHDHGGSSGAFTVVQGDLTEYVWRAGELAPDVRHEGDSTTFGPDHVHDVRNQLATPAVSVHAYSPPLRTMRFYEVATGRLRRWGQSWTDDPEAPAPERSTW